MLQLIKALSSCHERTWVLSWHKKIIPTVQCSPYDKIIMSSWLTAKIMLISDLFMKNFWPWALPERVEQQCFKNSQLKKKILCLQMSSLFQSSSTISDCRYYCDEVHIQYLFTQTSGNRNEDKSLHLFITFVWIIFSAPFFDAVGNQRKIPCSIYIQVYLVSAYWKIFRGVVLLRNLRERKWAKHACGQPLWENSSRNSRKVHTANWPAFFLFFR